jgi:4-alpha-glucanotransferase
MSLERSSGVLLHPTSFLGPFGIGDLGPSAIHWLDFMDSAGLGIWQILPLNPTGYGNSPYQSFSAFAGNSNLISPILLVEDGLLPLEEIQEHPHFPSTRVAYLRVARWKKKILKIAYKNFRRTASSQLKEEFDTFCLAQSYWLKDFSTFMAVKDSFKQVAWNQWPDKFKRRDEDTLKNFAEKKPREVGLYDFIQFCFHRQWQRVHNYAKSKNIKIIGDMPIYVAYDSADVWTHPELFELDADFNPRLVAGVPPDYFSPSGQLWGNPLFHWPNHQKTGYQWWLQRVESLMQNVDVIRLDHFRGFSGYWEVEAGMSTAEKGRWVKGPGNSFLDALKHKFGILPIIAENLGVISTDVDELLQQFQLPGMRILQFAFGSDAHNPFLPHNFPSHCVAYTGTHDNPTIKGWYQHLTPEEAKFCRCYLNSQEKEIVWGMIKSVWSSVAEYAITPMQDLLELGNQARMNYPGTIEHNWCWRLNANDLNDKLTKRIKEMNILYGRDKDNPVQARQELVIRYQDPEDH